MRFDDRLLTVLGQPAGDRHDSAVRWRQLVDLVARAGSNSDSPTVAQALDSIRTEAANVDESLRAAAARAVAALPLPLGLLEYFASDRLTVSAPVLAAATLDPDQWRALLAVADAETRKFIETLHPELGTSPPAGHTEELVEPAPEAQSVPALPSGTPSLHEVVARIERRRRSRASARSHTAGIPIAADPPALFRWECGPSGEIAWVEGAPRGALIGRSLARRHNTEGDRLDPDAVNAFARRAPFRDAVLTVAGGGVASGEWRISGMPAFEPTDGRFAGYRGIAQRDVPSAGVVEPTADLLSDPASLRELVHEIKTPLNAIIGFAEIIDGQYLGPADRRYRERAGEIVAQARLLVTAIDDLDFAARTHSAADGAPQRVNLSELVERLVASLRLLGEARGVVVDASRTIGTVLAAIEPELAERLILRLCTATIERAASGEHLHLSVDAAGNQVHVSISCPAALSAMSDAQLFGGSDRGLSEGFMFRLVRGLARIAGGDLIKTATTLALVFPRA